MSNSSNSSMNNFPVPPMNTGLLHTPPQREHRGQPDDNMRRRNILDDGVQPPWLSKSQDNPPSLLSTVIQPPGTNRRNSMDFGLGPGRIMDGNARELISGSNRVMDSHARELMPGAGRMMGNNHERDRFGPITPQRTQVCYIFVIYRKSRCISRFSV